MVQISLLLRAGRLLNTGSMCGSLTGVSTIIFIICSCCFFPRWLQSQSVKGYKQRTLHGAWMFRPRGRLPTGGWAAHRAPQPGWSEHAQWSRHGATRPICGGHVSQWQTLNVKRFTVLWNKGHTNMYTQTRSCQPEYACVQYCMCWDTMHTHTATKIKNVKDVNTVSTLKRTFWGNVRTNAFYICVTQSKSHWSSSFF